MAIRIISKRRLEPFKQFVPECFGTGQRNNYELIKQLQR